MHKKVNCFKRALALLGAVAIMVTAMPGKAVSAAGGTDKTATQVVSDMRVGWNIGNSLDSYGQRSNFPYTSSNETYWGNPKTTKALIDAVAEAGFNTIRIPVSWGQYTTGSNYQIPEFFMSRVKEVVDYCIANDMYVILNTHHDINNDYCFYVPNNANKSRSEAYFKSVWTQIGNTFKNYDYHLVFETMNEPRLVGHSEEWWFPRNNPSSDIKEAVACINDYNQVALDAIRATGGNNATRCVMVPGYDASIEGCMTDSFKMPKDSASNRLILSVHAYIPYYFALASDTYVTRFDQSNKSDIDTFFNDLNSKFLSKNVPVVVGETSATNRNNTAERVKWADYYWGAAAKYSNVAMVLWDNNIYDNNSAGSDGECHRYIDRNSLQWKDPEIIRAIMKHVDGTPATINGKEIPGTDPQPAQPSDPEPTQPTQPTEPTNPSGTVVIEDGWYYIKGVQSQKYLSVEGNRANGWTNVCINSGSGVDGQKWYVTNTNNGTVTLTSALGNFMLDVANGQDADSANIGIYQGYGGNAQQFVVKSTNNSGIYTIATKCSNEVRYLDVNGHRTDDGTNVIQYRYNGNQNQQWQFEKANGQSQPVDPQPSDPEPIVVEPDPEPIIVEPDPEPVSTGLDFDYTINSWGSGYQVSYKIINNTGSTVNGWTLKVNKNQINIDSSWNVNIKVSGNYYVITPVDWNKTIYNGSSIEFGSIGVGSVGNSFDYELN